MNNKMLFLLFVGSLLFSACQVQSIPVMQTVEPIITLQPSQTSLPEQVRPTTSPTILQPVSTPAITNISIDGDASDWPVYGERVNDRIDDIHGGGFDIKSVNAIANDRYLYVIIEPEGIYHDFEQIDLDVVTNDKHFVVSFNPDTCFVGNIGQDIQGQWKDIGDVQDAEIAGKKVIEYKIALSYFGDFDTLQFGVRPMGGKCCQYPGWYPIDDIGLVRVLKENEIEPKSSQSISANRCKDVYTIPQKMDLTAVRGDEIHELVISADGKRAYTMSRGTDLIFTIDLSTNQIISWLDISPGSTTPYGPSPEALALSPNGQLLISANQTDDSVTIIDTKSNTILKKLPAPIYPMNIAISPDGKVAYVVGHGEDQVEVIDLTKLEVLKKIALPQKQTNPYAVAFTSDGKFAYVGTESKALYRIDASTHKVVDSISKPPSGWSNGELVITSKNQYAYLSSLNGNWVIKFNLVEGKFEKIIEIQMPEGLALSPDGKLLMVGRMGGGGESKYRVVAISTENDQIIGGVDYSSPANHVSWENDVQGMAFTPDGKLLYIPVVDADGVFIADVKTLRETGFIPLTAFARYQPTRVLVNPDGSKLYVMNYYPQPTSVSIIDLMSGSIHQFQSDRKDACMKAARGIALSPKGDILYIATSEHCILAVNTSTNEVINELHSGGKSGLSDLAIHPDGKKAYVIDLDGMFYELDLINNTVLRTLNTVPGAHYLKLAPDGKRAYISGSRGYAIVDLNKLTLLHTEDYGAKTGAYDQATQGTFSTYFMRQIGIKPNLSQYVVGEFQSMHVYDAASFKELQHINLFNWTRSMALSTDILFAPDGKTGYAAMWDEKVVIVFDAIRWKATDVIDVGRAPYFGVCPRYLALSPDGMVLYVANEQSDNITAIDTQKKQIIRVYNLLDVKE